MKAIVLGIISALFFAVTFVLNASMEQAGGHWAWSASLRYFFMVPLLIIIVWWRKKYKPLVQSMTEQRGAWLLWSVVGFGFFYAPLCFAAMYAPGWLIAGTWQITIVAGALLSPFFFTVVAGVKVRGQIPWRMLALSSIILVGIMLMQAEHAQQIQMTTILLGICPIIVAAFMYPLGNRKMMEVTQGTIGAFERLLGMTLASMPFWLLLAVYAYVQSGFPSMTQLLQTAIVAISSGIIATALFFAATDLVKGDMKKLAGVEATQSLEVLFALIGEVLLLSILLPSTLGLIGIVIVMAGMGCQSLYIVLQSKKTLKV